MLRQNVVMQQMYDWAGGPSNDPEYEVGAWWRE